MSGVVDKLLETLKPKKCSGMTTEEIFSGLWVSVETVTALLTQVCKELDEANLLCELQASRISGLETFKKQQTEKEQELSGYLSSPREGVDLQKGFSQERVNAIDALTITCYAANGDEVEMLDPKDAKQFLMNLLLDKVMVSRKQLSELFETKRKEWKIAYPLKSREDFNYRVLIDEIFDELMKELLAGSVGEEK